MLDQPDGVGELSLTRLTVKEDGLCCDFRGQVEGYGTVYASHRFVYDSKNTYTENEFLHTNTSRSKKSF